MRKWKWCVLAIVLSPCFAQAQNAEKAQPYPRQVTGEGLAAHFRETWSVNATTSRQLPLTFFNGSDGSVRLKSQTTSRTPDGFGTREIKADKGQVCLNITTTAWRGATGCYRLVETEPKAFSLVRGSYQINYRR